MFLTQNKYRNKWFKVTKNSRKFVQLILCWQYRSIKVLTYFSGYIDLKRMHVNWSVLKCIFISSLRKYCISHHKFDVKHSRFSFPLWNYSKQHLIWKRILLSPLWRVGQIKRDLTPSVYLNILRLVMTPWTISLK